MATPGGWPATWKLGAEKSNPVQRMWINGVPARVSEPLSAADRQVLRVIHTRDGEVPDLRPPVAADYR